MRFGESEITGNHRILDDFQFGVGDAFMEATEAELVSAASARCASRWTSPAAQPSTFATSANPATPNRSSTCGTPEASSPSRAGSIALTQPPFAASGRIGF
jgi:hypothetical protein